MAAESAVQWDGELPLMRFVPVEDDAICVQELGWIVEACGGLVGTVLEYWVLAEARWAIEQVAGLRLAVSDVRAAFLDMSAPSVFYIPVHFNGTVRLADHADLRSMWTFQHEPEGELLR
ncbi:hypothetical protein OH77DRAFT_1517879 [Trametes cingulata]|nr:hypothetical protein OH77DRAFT_1517879 [Trametes cingulata]